jgi:antitoxin HigA-1
MPTRATPIPPTKQVPKADPEHKSEVKPEVKPHHIGSIIRKEVFEAHDMCLSEAAIALGVTRQAVADLLGERSLLTIDMALRIEKAFGLRMEPLMRIQLEFEMAAARVHQVDIEVSPYLPWAMSLRDVKYDPKSDVKSDANPEAK